MALKTQLVFTVKLEVDTSIKSTAKTIFIRSKPPALSLSNCEHNSYLP